MHHEFLRLLVKEHNWYIRLWLGGALYDNSIDITHIPVAVPETFFVINTTRLKHLRDLVIDLQILQYHEQPKNNQHIRKMLLTRG